MQPKGVFAEIEPVDLSIGAQYLKSKSTKSDFSIKSLSFTAKGSLFDRDRGSLFGENHTSDTDLPYEITFSSTRQSGVLDELDYEGLEVQSLSISAFDRERAFGRYPLPIDNVNFFTIRYKLNRGQESDLVKNQKSFTVFESNTPNLGIEVTDNIDFIFSGRFEIFKYEETMLVNENKIATFSVNTKFRFALKHTPTGIECGVYYNRDKGGLEERTDYKEMYGEEQDYTKVKKGLSCSYDLTGKLRVTADYQTLNFDVGDLIDDNKELTVINLNYML